MREMKSLDGEYIDDDENRCDGEDLERIVITDRRPSSISSPISKTLRYVSFRNLKELVEEELPHMFYGEGTGPEERKEQFLVPDAARPCSWFRRAKSCPSRKRDRRQSPSVPIFAWPLISSQSVDPSFVKQRLN